MNRTRRAKLNALINALNDLKSDVELLQEEEQEAFDNLPESIQETERGESMQDAADSMSDAMDLIDEAVEALETAME